MPADRSLIVDLGMHEAQDTAFYLKKGFRVVSVDANRDLCEQAERGLESYVKSGQLTIVNRAIAEVPGEVTFYQDAFTAWSTVDPRWAARNRRLGSRQVEHVVEATTIANLTEEFGVPYYLKIDIEGMDLVALRGLRAVSDRPHYVSIESDKTSFRALREEFDTFTELGYDAFKVVSQRNVPKQQLPQPAREGTFVSHRFEVGATGSFGDETPGRWIGADAAVNDYRRVFLRYAFNGDDPLIRSWALRNLLKAAGFRYDWFDTHARLGS